jgi:hypothetical protein
MPSNQECEYVPSMGCVRSRGQAFGVFGDGWNDQIGAMTWSPAAVAILASRLRDVKEDSMSNQVIPIIPRGRRQSVPEAPVNSQYAARFLNMHPKTVLRKAREGSLPGHPVGRDRKRWNFYLSELDHWLRSQVISGSHPRRQPQGDYIG